jgi:PAS domain S-box-containing protein
MEDKIHILIIDDDEVDRMAIRRAVKKGGMDAKVTGVDSIEGAWDAVKNAEFDCVFLDYRLPGGDGLELLQELRKAGYIMPVIVVTSQGDEKIAVKVMKSGGSDYISKNLINPEVIGQIVRNSIRTHKSEQERLRTSAELQISQRRLSEAQRIANIGSWEMETANGIRYWSEQVYLILGYPDSSSVEPNQDLFTHHIHPEDLPRAEDYLLRCIRNAEHFRFDMRIITVSGEVRPVEIQGRALRNKENRTVKVVGTMQDIHERKEIEKELIEARDIAERSAKAREEFLANMSHEIRTPMNAIIGFTKLLYDSQLDAEQMESLKAIDAAGEALMAIINDILDLSKIEAGMLNFEERPFHLGELLQSLRGIFRARVKEKSLSLESFLGPDVPLQIVGDKVRLNQVLINLVGNAIKFTPEGEINVSVKLRSLNGNKAHLLFEVEDSGIGIAPEKQQAIFESFTQASNETTRNYGGTGLGLTICKRIVELQGGHIGVRSTPGEGSCFYFDLEFAIADGTVIQERAPTDLQSGDSTELQEIRRDNYHILLAEDNLMNQKLAGRVLEKLGYTFEIAGTGRRAFELVQQGQFDVVLMDIQMPEMDGYEATRKIRALSDETLRTIPIIALTAHALMEEMEKCIAAGMDEFISKPFQPEILRDKIRLVIGAKSVSNGESSSTPAPSESSGHQFIDLKSVDELAGDSAEFKLELIDIFMEDVPDAVEKMRHGLENKDGEAIYQAVHGVKPSLTMFSLKGHGEIVEQLETLSRIPELPFLKVEALIRELETSLEGAFPELEKEKQGLAKKV